MKVKQDQNYYGDICILHDQKWLDRQRVAGKIAGQTLSLLEQLVKEKTVKSLLELDQIAGQFITDSGCSATFLGYKGFPNNVCMSIDNEKLHTLVHGIPTDYQLQDGDLISFDVGCTYEGAIGDTAITCIYGKPKSEKYIALIQDTKDALTKGIEVIKIGDRIGVIGHAIYQYLSSKNYSVSVNYGGHSLDYNIPHAFPFVSNRASVNEGIRLCANQTLAIEPLSILGGSNKTHTGKDGWSVFTQFPSCHFEHTIYIHQDGSVEVITARSN